MGTQSTIWWFTPFLYLAITVQVALTYYYYQSGEIAAVVAGLMTLVLFVLALWGAKFS